MIAITKAPLCGALMLSLLCAVGSTAAQSKPKGSVSGAAFDQAGELFDKGITLQEQGRWAEAEAAFQQAWELQPRFDVAANLGDCELHIGQAAEAAEHLGYAVRHFPISGKTAQRERLTKRYREAREQVGAITVRVNQEGADVSVDGRKVGGSPLSEEVFVAPGKPHAIEARLAGYATARDNVQLDKGERTQVLLTMVREGAARTATPPRATAPATRGNASVSSLPSQSLTEIGASTDGTPAPPRSLRPGIIAGALGLTGAAVGAGLLIASNGKADAAEGLNKAILDAGGYCLATTGPFAAQCDELHATTKAGARLHDVGIGFLVGGGIAVLAAGTYFLWPVPSSPRSSSFRVAPMVTLTGGGTVVHGAF